MAADGRRTDAGREGRGPRSGGKAWERPDEAPTWRRALNGIGWVVAMAVVVALVGLALSWLATLVL